MTLKIPTSIHGRNAEEDYNRVISRINQTPPAIVAEGKPQPGFIYIPSAKLHFAKQKTHFGKNWPEAHESLRVEGLVMPTMLELAQTLKYLKDNPNQENTELYNELIQVRAPWRTTFLDAYFEERKDGMYLLTENKTKLELLDKETLMKDGGISLESWVANPTPQGLPKKDVSKGDLSFWHPKKNSVAWLGVGDYGAVLDCAGYPAGGYSDAGVHAVRKAFLKIKNNKK